MRVVSVDVDHSGSGSSFDIQLSSADGKASKAGSDRTVISGEEQYTAADGHSARHGEIHRMRRSRSAEVEARCQTCYGEISVDLNLFVS